MTVYRLSPGFITQKIDNKTTIFSGQDSVLFTLNETGAYIFQGLKLNWTKEKIIDGLTKKYRVKKEQALSDMEEYIRILLEKKIILEIPD